MNNHFLAYIPVGDLQPDTYRTFKRYLKNSLHLEPFFYIMILKLRFKIYMTTCFYSKFLIKNSNFDAPGIGPLNCVNFALHSTMFPDTLLADITWFFYWITDFLYRQLVIQNVIHGTFHLNIMSIFIFCRP